jgi:hypothetical protein
MPISPEEKAKQRSRRECRKAFHSFLREQAQELEPGSPMWELLEITFRHGFCAGGGFGAKLIGERITGRTDAD